MPISASPAATAPPTNGGSPALPEIGRSFPFKSPAMPRRSNIFAVCMPLVPPLAGSVYATDRATSNVRLNPATVLISGCGMPFLTATPIAARPISAMLSFAILPSPSSVLMRGSVRIATSTGSPAAMRCSTPPAVAKSSSKRLPDTRSKSPASSCISDRKAPALRTLISAAWAAPKQHPPTKAATRPMSRCADGRVIADGAILCRFHALRAIDRFGLRRGKEIDQCLGGERLLGDGGGGGHEAQIRALQLAGKRTDDIDALHHHQLTNRLQAYLSFAARDYLADPCRALAGRRRNELGLRFQLGDAELLQSLCQVDTAGAAARRVDYGNRFGIEQGLLERVDRADIRFRCTFFDRHPDRRLCQRDSTPADQLGNADKLVDPRLGRDRDVDRLIGGDLLVDLAGCCVFDRELMARRFLESRAKLLQHRAHRRGAQHFQFRRTSRPGR